jgi:phosphohistidine phosphatase
MNLYLLRHAPATDREAAGPGGDAERPLTPEGREKLVRAIGGMRALGLSFRRIFTSPARRARETAEAVALALSGERPPETVEVLDPDADPAAVLAWLAGLDGDLLLVGHEPGLGRLAGLLSAGAASAAPRLKKAGLCKLGIRGPGPLPGGARLEWLLTPRQLALMGRADA